MIARRWGVGGLRVGLAGVLVMCLVGVLGVGVGVAGAGAAGVSGVGWEVFGFFGPTNLAPGGSGDLHLYVYDVGGAASSGVVTVTDRLPGGMTSTGSEDCSETAPSVVTCSFEGVEPAKVPFVIVFPVSVPADASGTAVNGVEVSGGGAVGSAHESIPVTFSSARAGLGFSNFDGWLSNADGSADTQAGSHPYAFTTVFSLNNVASGSEIEPAGGEARTLNVKLPPGLVGDTTAVGQCKRELFDNGEIGEDAGEGCPANSNIGWVTLLAKGLGSPFFPVYNLVPPAGVTTEFGFSITGDTNVILDVHVRSGGDDGVTVHVQNAPQREALLSSVTIWGVPGEASHDFQRAGKECAEDGSGGCGYKGQVHPFLTLPTSCGAPPLFGIEELTTWQDEAIAPQRASFPLHDESGAPTGLGGCGRLAQFNASSSSSALFAPSVSLTPEVSSADSPSGLTAIVRLPQGLNGEGLATPGLKDTTVTLPEGLVINPGQAAGLEACQPAQENLAPGSEAGESEAFDAAPSCPKGSIVGEDEIATPLLPGRLHGKVYVLQSNPPHIEILVAASGDGVNLKLVGKVELDPFTGRLTTKFEETPDLAFSEFKLTFNGGPKAALATPQRCGEYQTSARFTPWSEPFADTTSSSAFAISTAPGGGGCPASLPFSPSFTAGSTSDIAGGYTGFSMLLSRGDGQQHIGSLQFTTPRGLLGMISNIPLCGEAEANADACPEASKIGHTITTAGPGANPLVIPQPGAPEAPIYLTGPYAGAPYGLLIKVPVIAGPFNLGIQVVRGKIEVDPHTSQITITTGALPRIVEGVPSDLRTIYAIVDHANFMFNPTSCEPATFTGTATSTEGATSALSSSFRIGGCQALKFQPALKVSTSGRTSRLGGASLTAKLTYPTTPAGMNQASSQANIARVKVELPKRLPSRLSTLQKACTAAVFAANPANCPAQSVVGKGTVHTPVLPGPLSGPAYFVSHGGEAFPSLIIVLQGQNITIDLEATTFINGKTGVTTSTFKSVPDVPVSTFELELPQGPHSALAANGNLCKGALKMPTEFTAQNGAVIHQTKTLTVNKCPKAKKAKKHAKKADGKKKD
jgi:hypothetical protein